MSQKKKTPEEKARTPNAADTVYTETGTSKEKNLSDTAHIETGTLKREKDGRDSGNKSKLIILLLLLITLIAVGITIWALCFREKKTVVLSPDYAPQETEANAETIGDEDDEKLEASEGGGAVSLSYSTEVTISLSDETASLYFANPTKSTQDMVLQLVIQDTVIIQSGLLEPGNQVSTLNLLDGAAGSLEAGGYDGKFVILYYDPDSGEKAVVNTEIPVTITVAE